MKLAFTQILGSFYKDLSWFQQYDEYDDDDDDEVEIGFLSHIADCRPH